MRFRQSSAGYTARKASGHGDTVAARRRKIRLRSVCKHADELLDALALRGEHIGAHTVRLTQLLRQVGAAELDRAIAEALARGATGAGSVAHILDQRARARKQLPAIEATLPDDPRVRDLRVTPHALDRYDELYAKPSCEESEP